MFILIDFCFLFSFFFPFFYRGFGNFSRSCAARDLVSLWEFSFGGFLRDFRGRDDVSLVGLVFRLI